MLEQEFLFLWRYSATALNFHPDSAHCKSEGADKAPIVIKNKAYFSLPASHPFKSGGTLTALHFTAGHLKAFTGALSYSQHTC